MRRAALATTLLLPLFITTGTSGAASRCAVDLEQRGQWHGLSSIAAVAMDDTDPCRMLAVGAGASTRTSDDGGASWSTSRPAPAEAEAVVSAGLGERAFLLGKRGGAWVTRDRGTSWATVKGLSGAVDDIVAGDASTLFAVVRPAEPTLPVGLPATASGGLFESTDAGASFSPVRGAIGIAVSSVVPDAGVPSRLWIGVGGPAGGLFMSPDAGQTFSRTAGGDVRDVDSSRLAGGGSEVMAATADGFLISRDAGVTVTSRGAGTAYRNLSLEWNHPSAFMALADSPRRSSDAGISTRSQGDGLPPACAASQLRSNHSVPSVFLVTCANGSTWRYRSDGTDLSTTDQPDGSLAPDPAAGLKPVNATPMRVLGRHSVPSVGSRQDGSIAFDGATLYYADSATTAIVHRMVASSGEAMPDLHVTGPGHIAYLAYDANRDSLVMVDTSPTVWEVSIRTGQGRRLFDWDRTSNMTMTFDSATDRLLFAYEGDDFDEYTLAGRLVRSCSGLKFPHVITISGGGTPQPISIAGLVATGDGLVYAEAEDDSTVYRIDRSCHVLATFSHEQFSEAPAENDALACDTVTYATPAIWLRDARAGRVVAYAVDAGYCALPSSVSVSAPPGVAIGKSGTVCAHLITLAKKLPLPGLPVDLLVAGRGIGSPVTDRHGTACASYVPEAREAGASQGTSSSRQPVVAAFLGTAAYRPSSAQASLLVSRNALPPLPPLAPLPPISHPYVATLVIPPPPPPPVQPPPPPPNVPQSQPIAQAHPGAQPGAMGAFGAAPAPEDETAAAAQTGDVHNMSSLNAAPWESSALPLLGGVAMAIMAVRRRRASRVRPQF